MIKSVKHLAEYYLKMEKKELIELANDSKKYYNTFIKTQKKANGKVKKREITEATGVLKKVHKLIFDNILKLIEFPSPPFIGGLKGKDNVLNAHLHKGKKYIFCTDLKNFYPHINNKMVYLALVERGFSADVASIITKLTTYKGKLIQGGVNSTHLAYLTLWKTAKQLSNICEDKQIVFTIYVDDLTFSSVNDFKELSIELRNIVINNGFFVNHKKTFFTKGKAEITGVKVGQNTLNVKDDFRNKLNSSQNLTAKQKEGLQMYYERVVTYGKTVSKTV
ncbi:hypothetical protein CSC81_10240 [Tenacibaculum discolor]|uniref:Reverse transcriptase family protein n=1 Tax=Tenacibaculum discolor TaxID=361581 RepID=A0A2G1BV13_9FLAO|nr:reverse transcriptase family protein [Tenacibaculum discolor]MDP2541541.1 reverse transcriptase family protein [Tenacibaculum discolor]PHN97445.1 hypothetical protein CSC81_10240 [Tenacibaculum discolor]